MAVRQCCSATVSLLENCSSVCSSRFMKISIQKRIVRRCGSAAIRRSLGINNLTGPVPAELGNLTKLIVLSFSSNSLHGILPPELRNLTSLQELYIDSSGVSGAIPQELSNWKSLRILVELINHSYMRKRWAQLHLLMLTGKREVIQRC